VQNTIIKLFFIKYCTFQVMKLESYNTVGINITLLDLFICCRKYYQMIWWDNLVKNRPTLDRLNPTKFLNILQFFVKNLHHTPSNIQQYDIRMSIQKIFTKNKFHPFKILSLDAGVIWRWNHARIHARTHTHTRARAHTRTHTKEV